METWSVVRAEIDCDFVALIQFRQVHLEKGRFGGLLPFDRFVHSLVRLLAIQATEDSSILEEISSVFIDDHCGALLWL